mgnify:CR=1 FL=1
MKVLLLFLALGLMLASQQAALASTDNFHKYSNIKKLSDAIDDNKFDDDNINWNDFKSWNGFAGATESVQHCIIKAEHLGDNLGDYEIYDCVDVD